MTTKTKTAAIIIDDWKLPFFEARLKEAGYAYIQEVGISPDTLVLRVKYQDQGGLQKIVQSANKEARNSKLN